MDSQSEKVAKKRRKKYRPLRGQRLRERLELLAMVYITDTKNTVWDEDDFIDWFHSAYLDRYLAMLRKREMSRILFIMRRMGFKNGRKFNLDKAERRKWEIYRKLYEESGKVLL